MTSVLRVAHSVFDVDALSAWLGEKWGWRGAKCDFWNRGPSDTYRIVAGARRAYLRVSRYRWRSLQEIGGELEVLRSLRQGGLRVPAPIETTAGALVARVAAPEGPRYAVLFTEAKGVSPPPDRSACRAFGRIAATVHGTADALLGRVRTRPIDMHQVVRDPLGHLAPFLAHRRRDLKLLRQVTQELYDAVVSSLPQVAPAFGLCHGDLHFGNVHRDRWGRLALFDFDSCGIGWRAYDLAVFLWSRAWALDRSARAARAMQWSAFLEGYQSVRTLAEGEVTAAKMFVPLRHVWVLGLHARLHRDNGRRILNDAYLDAHIAFIRGWLRVYKLP